jgi:hypothetical protein
MKKMSLCHKSEPFNLASTPRGMVVLIKSLGHERHELFLTKTFD